MASVYMVQVSFKYAIMCLCVWMGKNRIKTYPLCSMNDSVLMFSVTSDGRNSKTWVLKKYCDTLNLWQDLVQIHRVIY